MKSLSTFLGARANGLNLPRGWSVSLLDTVARRGSGHTPSKSVKAYWDGDVKWVSLRDLERLDKVFLSDTTARITDEGIANSSAVKHPPGTVVVSRDARVGLSGIMADEMAVSQHFITWQCGPELHNMFLYYWLQLLKPEFERIATGSTIKTIGLSFFRSLPVILPPRPEQERLAATLYEWDKALLRLEALVEAKRRYKAGMTQVVLSCHRPGLPTPGGWSRKRLKQVLTESRELSSSGAEARRLTVRLYGRGVVTKANHRPGSANTQYYRRRAGQFIYSKLDFLNGAFGIVPTDLDGYESTLDVPAFELSDEVHGPWLLHLFSWPDFYKRYVRIAHGGRKARRVNPLDLLEIEINLPPLEEQRAVAGLLSNMNQEITLLESLRDRLTLQKRVLLDKLFTGLLRLTPSNG